MLEWLLEFYFEHYIFFLWCGLKKLLLKECLQEPQVNSAAETHLYRMYNATYNTRKQFLYSHFWMYLIMNPVIILQWRMQYGRTFFYKYFQFLSYNPTSLLKSLRIHF